MELPIKEPESQKNFADDEIPERISIKQVGKEDRSSRKSNQGLIVLLVIASIVVAGGIWSALGGTSSNNKSESETEAFLESETIEPYVSSEHGFSAIFPEFPTTEHSSVDIEGISVPLTQYTEESEDGKKFYMIQVVNYPTSDFEMTGQERGSLDGAMNGMAQSDGYTLVNSSNSGTFLGYPSAEATYSVEVLAEALDAYVLSFIKGNDLYLIMTIGEDKVVFDDFVQSFKF